MLQLLKTGITVFFFAVFVLLAVNSSAQESAVDSVTPEGMGFLARSLTNKNSEVHYYLSTEGKPLEQSRKLPLILFLDGSGPTPLFWGDNEHLGSSMMFDASDFPGYHFVVIGKPGVRFHEPERRINSQTYDNVLSLRWRVEAANSVINSLVAEHFVDPKKVLVIGHSEGADVAPWVARENKHVTHVAGLAPGGLSQMLDFVMFTRKQVASGQLDRAEGDQEISDIKQAFKEIFADPKSTTKKWQGETYLRWSTFFRPGNEAWCELEKPVYLGICRDDQNTPVECGEAIQLEFIRLGKPNLTSRVWPCDHYFIEALDKAESASTDHRTSVVRDILEWAQQN